MKRSIVVTGANGALGGLVAKDLEARGLEVVPVSVRGFDSAAWSKALQGRSPYGAFLAAGAWKGGAPIHEEKDEGIWRAMIESNLDSARAALGALLPGMVARGEGSIVVVGSRAAVRPETSAGAAAYAASKGGLIALIEAVAKEVVQHGVRVNAVLPSTIDTAANRAAMPTADASKWVKPESIAEVAAFLLSDAARDVSGAAIPVYGRA